MSVALTCTSFWGNIITDKLNEALNAQGDNVLINLASNEYFKAVKPKSLDGQIITPVFKDCKNGQYKVISFYAKKARGMMARYIIENKIDSVEALTKFDTAGYYFVEEESNAKRVSPSSVKSKTSSPWLTSYFGFSL